MEDFPLQVKAMLTIAVAFFVLGKLMRLAFKFFPDDKDNVQAVSRLVGYIHHVSAQEFVCACR